MVIEESDGFLDWWWAHKALVASLILFPSSFGNIYFFHFIAQRRLSKVSLSKVARQDRHLRWLKRGSSVWFWGTSLLVVVGLLYLRGSRTPVASALACLCGFHEVEASGALGRLHAPRRGPVPLKRLIDDG